MHISYSPSSWCILLKFNLGPFSPLSVLMKWNTHFYFIFWDSLQVIDIKFTITLPSNIVWIRSEVALNVLCFPATEVMQGWRHLHPPQLSDQHWQSSAELSWDASIICSSVTFDTSTLASSQLFWFIARITCTEFNARIMLGMMNYNMDFIFLKCHMF